MSGPQLKYVKPKTQLPKVTLTKFINWPKEINFNMENVFSNLNLVKIVIKWRLHLIIIITLAIALSVLFSSPWFITPKYKSSAVLYPSNLIPYSSETPTELMLQIFNSGEIRDSLINKYNLASHYNIDINNYSNVVKEFESNVDIRKTEYESVVIDILDKDPQIACKMVKEMVNQFNIKAIKMQREKAMEVLKIKQNQLDQKQKEIDTLQKKLNILRTEYGILDYKVQTKESMKAYFKMISERRAGNDNSVTTTIENLETKGGDFILTSDLLSSATTSYHKYRDEYDNAYKDVTKELTYSNYVSSPLPADKKSYPVRWLIVLVTTVTTIIFAFVIIMLLENYRENKMESNSPGA